MNMRALVTWLLLTGTVTAAELPQGYWPVEQSQPILETTLRIRLDPDLGHLSPAESSALAELLSAGEIMNTLYEQQRHPQALQAKEALEALHAESGDAAATQNLLDLYYMSKGPIATTLDNVREGFVPVNPELPGKNVYPQDVTREELDAWLAANPSRSGDLLNTRTVVHRIDNDNIAADLARLDNYPEIDVLHAGLRHRLESLLGNAGGFYAVPYALAYAPELRQVRQHLNTAAAVLEDEDSDLAAYLRNRGRDLLSGDYESGDAAWVSGDFGNLNIQIGSYETYDDSLLGVKAFFSASILGRDAEKSAALQEAIAELQAIEDTLPYEHQKTVRPRIPVGVYNVIADFGQARGTNTATILPNDADYSRKYGRTILIRNNILTDPKLFANSKRQFDAVVDLANRADLTADSGFDRTLWHEIGHYLGPSKTTDGRDLADTLLERADLFEELKSDLVSLFAAPALHQSGYYDDDSLRAVYAAGIRRTLQTVPPRPDQPYQNMQLMQFNFYVEYGLANRFVERWNYWDDNLHGRFGELMRNSGSFRRRLVRYAALGD